MFGLLNGLEALWTHRQLRVAALGMAAYNLGWSIADDALVLFAAISRLAGSTRS